MNPLAKAFLNFAFFLDSSARYQNSKRFIYNLLENNNYFYKKFIDLFLVILIMVSIYIIIEDVKRPVDEDWIFFNNYVISIIFMVEYALRFWVFNNTSRIIINQYEDDTLIQRRFCLLCAVKKVILSKWEYVSSLKAIIDLLAVLPFFHQLRLLRVFVLFRVFKIFRYTSSIQLFLSAIATKKSEFTTLLLFVLIINALSAVVIYVIEGNNPNSPIDTLFEAFYWSLVTISTVGYGDITPVTTAGRFVAMIIIVIGIGVISFSTSIVVSAFTEKLDEIKESKIVTNLSNKNMIVLICGYNALAVKLYKLLANEGEQVFILEKERAKVTEAQNKQLNAICTDPGQTTAYKKLQIKFHKVKALVAVHDSDILNVYTILTVRELAPEKFIISLVNNEINKEKLLLAGANEAVYVQEVVGILSNKYCEFPAAYAAINSLFMEYGGMDIDEIVVDEAIINNHKVISHIDFDTHHLILLGIWKDNIDDFIFNPQGDYELELGDTLIVAGMDRLISGFKYNLLKVH